MKTPWTVAAVVLALWLVGCDADSPSRQEPFELAHSLQPADGRSGACSLGWWTAGRLVADGDRGTSIIVEGGDFGHAGDKLQILWWPRFTGWGVGSEVAILDPDGRAVAITGRRYRISAAFPFDAGFVVCKDEVTPL
jgi:hypothetical protein